MNEFIEKNRRLLKSYCLTARIIGWVLLITAGIWAVSTLSGHTSFSIPFVMPITIFIRILVGLVVLGVAQFIRYLFETEYKPGLILRHGEKILYLYAVLQVIRITFLFFVDAKRMGDSIYYSPWGFLVANWLPVVASALILVGLAQILRRMMPIIEESKTLV
ncbi:MAG: hypothetical protein PVH77_10590 [Phycisphaerales bacterium]|jgi:hypothetical protein